MAFTWNKKRIEWYLDASYYGDYHKQLAKKITPYLRKQDRVCDFGCGLGMLDIQLATAIEHMTCVDIDPVVLEHLRREAAKLDIQNLSTVCGDANTHAGQYDVALMVFSATRHS